MKKSEKQLTNEIIEFLNNYQSKKIWVYKRFATNNEVGQPDITGIYDGRRVEIEVKAPHLDRGSVEANLELGSKLQRYYIRKYAQLGAITGVVCGLNEVKELMGLE